MSLVHYVVHKMKTLLHGYWNRKGQHQLYHVVYQVSIWWHVMRWIPTITHQPRQPRHPCHPPLILSSTLLVIPLHNILRYVIVSGLIPSHLPHRVCSLRKLENHILPPPTPTPPPTPHQSHESHPCHVNPDNNHTQEKANVPRMCHLLSGGAVLSADGTFALLSAVGTANRMLAENKLLVLHFHAIGYS